MFTLSIKLPVLNVYDLRFEDSERKQNPLSVMKNTCVYEHVPTDQGGTYLEWIGIK